ncbi:unnamed protein product [Mesocestoides corti]|uniref:Ubiquitin carboxyl-terminal hydrolase 7 n=1 Tax=Mesocestoides corti TaxID=53468 RepID=A0A0R3UG66_MESCO|nr:unnamed protein product [Mesocestoides corti]
MPLKQLAGQGDDRCEESMDLDFNSNAIRTTDSSLQFPDTQIGKKQDLLKKNDSPDPQIEDLSEDYEDPARPSGTIEWEFTNIEDPRILSNPVIIRCLPWKILIVFPRPDSRPSMGMFLQCNADSPQTTWTCYGRAKLELLSQTKGQSKTYTIRHVFAAKENDWGYQSFISYADLFNPDSGYVVNKTLRARIHVEADAPHGAEWDSKKLTGFVGLKNQGATCYLNSVLQAFYFTNALRKAVFQMPTESDDIATSVPLALQRTFFDLQCSDMAIGTEKLTRSFGWTTLDSFMQHDAQELCRVLLETMESKMKGTDVEAIIPRLFCGNMVSYIKCKNVDCESRREEEFYDIQLKVKGNRGVEEAFKEYVEVETLDKDNKYDAGKFGLQDAEKGIWFLRFPPVLYLHLMRFQYDFLSNTNFKINDRFEFPYELDLSDYLLKESGTTDDKPQYTKYFLHAVLVHSGDHHGGHYVVYINPRGDNKWYQFDDDVVCSCMPKDAIEQNYGSDEPDSRAFTNAYMLVYIACDAREEVLCPVTEEIIPTSLSNRFQEDRSLEEQKRRVKDSAHEFATVNLLLEEDFYGFEGPELLQINEIPIRSVRVPRQGTDSNKLLEAVAKFLQWPLQDLCLWRISQRKAGGAVDFSPQIPADLSADSILTLWVHRRDLGAPPVVHPNESRLLFFKYYDPRLCTLSYCGHAELPLSGPVDALSFLNERVGLPPDAPLVFYQLNATGQPHRLDLSSSLRHIKHGEVICFHIDTSQSKGKEVMDQLLLATSLANNSIEDSMGNNHSHRRYEIPQDASLHLYKMAIDGREVRLPEKPLSSTLIFADYLKSSAGLVDILLVDKLRKSDVGILIRVSSWLSYSAFAELAAGYLSGRADHLQFFTCQPVTSTAVSATTNKGGAGGPQQDLHAVATNPPPLSNEFGSGNCYSPNGASGGVSVLSEQARAARASGFVGASANVIGALASAAHQGLIREPPGPPIPSTTTGTLRDFLSLPPNVSTIATQYPTGNAGAQDRPPLCVSRYSGVPRITPSPFSNHNFHTPAPRRVYYAHTALPVRQLESLKQIQVAFFGPRLSDRLDLALSVPGNGVVSDILAEVRSHVSLSGSGKLRLMEIRSNRIMQIYDESYPLEKIDTSLVSLHSDLTDNLHSGLRVEEIPLDEENLQQDDLVINAAHFHKDCTETFGVPFTVRVRNGELYSDVKKRIRERLEFVNEKEFDAWNFVLVTRHKSISIPIEEDVPVKTEIFTSDKNATSRPWLGVVHKPPKRPRYAPSEKSIKIHN